MNTELLLNEKRYAGVTITNEQRYLMQGQAWRIGTGYVTLASAADYVTINFTTPATGISLYSFSTIDKSGDELSITLIEGGSYSGGTATPLWNYNRQVGDANPPFTAKTGLSTAGATITGGTSAPIRIVPGKGTGVGGNKQGASSEAASAIILKNSTSYTLKITAIGSATTLAALFSVVYIPVSNI